ncbi:hypothetical protein BJF78_14995 [Pseudonocardia sp. CNS-139]|nr:hypothetical protein BJF78_14995 [Pseudonocardia sp. CNS-139]
MSGGIPEAPPVRGGDRVYRIHWVLGADRLRGVCHCGSERIFDDPVELWEWLLAHPDGHEPGDVRAAGPGPTAPARRLVATPT